MAAPVEFVFAVLLALTIVFAVFFATSAQRPECLAGSSSSKTTLAMIKNTANPFDHFDMVYYINLDARTDRKAQIEKELDRLGIRKRKRIPGVVAEFGQLGCAMAHLNALQDCEKNAYGSCLILEDDFMFSSVNVRDAVERFWSVPLVWDVVMFAGVFEKFETTPVDLLLRVISAQTTSAYAVNRSFLPRLLANVRDSIHKLKTIDRSYCIDQHWKTLQPDSHWFAFCPVLGYQRDSFSDIEGRDVSYIDRFNAATNTVPIHFLRVTTEPTSESADWMPAFRVQQDDTLAYDFQIDLKNLCIWISKTTSPAHTLSVVAQAVSALHNASLRLKGQLKSAYFGNAQLTETYVRESSDLRCLWGPPTSSAPITLDKGDLHDMSRLRQQNPQLADSIDGFAANPESDPIEYWPVEFGISFTALAEIRVQPLPDDYSRLKDHYTPDEVYWFADVCAARFAAKKNLRASE